MLTAGQLTPEGKEIFSPNGIAREVDKGRRPWKSKVSWVGAGGVTDREATEGVRSVSSGSSATKWAESVALGNWRDTRKTSFLVHRPPSSLPRAPGAEALTTQVKVLEFHGLLNAFIFYFIFLRWNFIVFAQAGMQWCDLGSLQPSPPWFK